MVKPKHEFTCPRRSAGFTLIELMLAVAILVILLGIAVPAYQSAVADQKVRAAASTLHSALLLARAEAIKLNQTVTLRPAATENWTQGWLITNPASPANDAAALHRDRLDSAVTVTSAAASLAFRASGRLTAAGGASFELESITDATKQRCVTIGLDGRPVTEKGGC